MILIFNDRGHTVCTSTWTVVGKPGDEARIIYAWGPDGVGFLVGDPPVTVERFLGALLARRELHMWDLRQGILDAR